MALILVYVSLLCLLNSNGAAGYTIDGQTNPSIMCNVGDTITFQVQATNNPFYIKVCVQLH